MNRLIYVFLVISILTLLSACSQTTAKMQTGYYTAEAASFDSYGWKEYITIYVSDNKIVTADYNAKNASGFIKSWDMDYMRTMELIEDTYPNEYTRTYSVDLVDRQDPTKVDAVSGATHSYHSFKLLAESAISKAKSGDNNIAYVKMPNYNE